MRISIAAACALVVLPHAGFAQMQQAASELARARSLLELSRVELTAQQYALLSSRLAETEAAYVELTTVTQATGEAAAVAAEGGAVSTAISTGGRALVGGLAELLPALLFVWPSTAHAPGYKEEKPEVRAARVKLEERAKALAQAAHQVEAEKKAAASRAIVLSDDTTCHLDGSGGGGPGTDSPVTCTYHCNGTEIIIVLPLGVALCPGFPTHEIKWKKIKGYPRKP
ncbi:MAG TPA: hypothetical protein VFA20_29510 [Myxococcaceae bacterium]|nr:hypothetical protein [Myxococcaceae bacterium]